MRTAEAWNRFGPANGVPDLARLVTKVTVFAARHSSIRSVLDADPTIGSIDLRDPVLLETLHFRAPDTGDAPVPRHGGIVLDPTVQPVA